MKAVIAFRFLLRNCAAFSATFYTFLFQSAPENVGGNVGSLTLENVLPDKESSYV